KYRLFSSQGERNRYQGLTFWSPNVNIFRDPRWGRGQETYGEDPYLTSRMGVAFVKGLQGDDPHYFKTDATAKHFAVHSGPEFNRHEFNATPSERDLYETYLPAFKALVQEGKVAAVMGAYNRVNGESASASKRLLQDILRGEWGFKGYVVSDCDSIEDIYLHHKIVKTAAEAAALGIKTGMDLNCGKTYAALLEAVNNNLITEAQIDTALKRLMYARLRLGLFDPPAQVPWNNLPNTLLQSAEHNQLARRAAQKSMVLLKNNGLLPLKKDLKAIAVIGPTADEPVALLGNYYGTPASPVTFLKGIQQAVSPSTQVYYARGADLVDGRQEPRAAPIIASKYLRPHKNSAEQGLTGEYFRGKDLAAKPVLTRTDSTIAFRWDRNSPTDELVARGELNRSANLDKDNFSIRWRGQLIAPITGEYEIHLTANDGARLTLGGKTLIDAWQATDHVINHTAKINLTAGEPQDIQLDYFEDIRDAEIRLAWRLPGAKAPLQEALEAAAKAEVIIVAAGLTSEVEGEEMKVNYPGFNGGDRTDLRLPKPQQELLTALNALGKPIVLVLTGGGALAVDWAQENIPAILMAWYPGQAGGAALADILFGDVSPSGRLPVTFYSSGNKLPDFQDYSMQGRTYRYFAGTPLYPFGHGLGYSQFSYSQLKTAPKLRGNQSTTITATIKNTGNRPATEVVQLYVRPIKPGPQDALKQLRGINTVDLAAGEEKTLHFTLAGLNDFAVYDPAKHSFVVKPGDYEVQLGASSADIRLRKTIRVSP
ncbi:MAG TPA: glycoside hydrolase family 3 C-terminal domain-containing protein, partial [Cellvibrionaceae bacterium]|nr:glycoside hydrolase family 3 C-terminal domain-containing protein [Cellvibrionaceae bacterium]